MLMRAGIPYRIYGGLRFYDRKEVKDIIAYLRCIINPSDDVSLRRIINQPKRAIGESTIQELVRYAAEKEMPLYSALIELPDTLSARPRKCVHEFGDLLNELVLEHEDMGLSDFVKHLIEKTGLRAQYEKDLSDEAKSRMENMDEFLGACERVRTCRRRTDAGKLSGKRRPDQRILMPRKPALNTLRS